MNEVKISAKNGDKGMANLGFQDMESETNGNEAPYLEILEENPVQKSHFGSRFKNVTQPFSKAKSFYKTHRELFHKVFLGILCVGYLAYFIAACYLDYHRALALIILTSLALAFLAYSIVKKCLGAKIIQMFSPCRKCCEKAWPWLKWVLCAILLIALITWLVLDVSQRKEQLVSLGGFCVLVFLLFLFSKHPMAVSWRAVFWGLGLQFVLGIFIIRTEPGFQAFQWLGNQIQIFLNYTTAGSSFVFGEKLIQESFAFQALPIVIFFSCVMSILYYLGVMQFVILKLSWLLQITMGTAATESLSVVGNIFVGMTEAPLLIRPYLGDMTRSEVHAVMTGGFATIAGSVMGAYISFGIDASSLIAASVMAAPCALAMAKLVYPEVETSKFQSCEGIKIACGEEKNILEAAGNGASVSVGLVANIAANLIAFLAVLAFINAALSWLGGMVNLPQLSFQLICSYVLMPLAFLLGASWEDASLAAEMVGIKFFLNEFVAYQQLSTYKNNRLMGLPEWDGSQKQWISPRAETILTFALCGFANLSSIGIMLGGLTSMAPQRKSEFSSIVLRALITGATVSLINACIAGILYVPRDVPDCLEFFSNTIINSTSYSLHECCKDLFGSSLPSSNGSLSFNGIWETLNSNTTQTYLQKCCGYYSSSICPK
ncbi:sodium/nucleoside cotransporter 1-like [Crotalus tigris]|uniref:sodium/nucleoside cotransporter 1-like n=1 Tax=Crotalus tigris TaxID=88082 RepID=UPI00192F90D9|nr:sodium/nucleoside cotransporter 1-like [Crotalus tigris]XP_039195426.1 sodium/nucleoside cotransporter 1-like [Crotalus tigris]XP_039195428.1 sodium/nucleoside cotransporter 1-like [Crotalus tigris]XP_039195429.1 sodium/nucleoside cotransporter 1-like [Crotalus tigris]XP_039195430.1 sodium/nucleoside cotransporter 1-like [Crotalus tigris]